MPQRSAVLLADAADLIQEFKDGLDVSTTDCACCTRTSYVNLHEARTAEELDGVLTKLRRRAASFLRAENERAPD